LPVLLVNGKPDKDGMSTIKGHFCNLCHQQLFSDLAQACAVTNDISQVMLPAGRWICLACDGASHNQQAA
jgi:RNase P subunit RPR2